MVSIQHSPIVLLLTAFWPCTARGADQSRILDTLAQEHPRLILNEDALQSLKKQAETDELLQSFVRAAIRRADGRLDDAKLEYVKRGPRLLHISKACLDRVYELGIAWRWTGEKKYAEKIQETLLTVCDFPDWNPSHFLDAAEMSHAVGVGYDWIYHELDEASRNRIRSALVDLGLQILAKHRIAEGLPLCLETMEIYKWGKAKRIPRCLKALESYGGAAKPLLPQIKQLKIGSG